MVVYERSMYRFEPTRIDAHLMTEIISATDHAAAHILVTASFPKKITSQPWHPIRFDRWWTSSSKRHMRRQRRSVWRWDWSQVLLQGREEAMKLRVNQARSSLRLRNCLATASHRMVRHKNGVIVSRLWRSLLVFFRCAALHIQCHPNGTSHRLLSCSSDRTRLQPRKANSRTRGQTCCPRRIC